MNDIDNLEEQIKNKIIETYQLNKKELFDSNGEIFGRHWDDLTPKYKKWKAKQKGSAYPINIFTGELLKELLDNALEIDFSYDDDSDKMNFKINVNSDKIGLKYADYVNNKREYISFSDDEKKIIINVINTTIKEFFGESV